MGVGPRALGRRQQLAANRRPSLTGGPAALQSAREPDAVASGPLTRCSTTRPRGPSHAALYGILLIGVLLACSPSGGRGTEPRGAEALRVVASIEPLAMIVREIGGPRVAVHTLLPPGGSPHTYAPRPSDLRQTAAAAWLIRIGHHFDPWAGSLFRAAGTDIPTTEVLELPGLDLRVAGAHHHDAPHGPKGLDQDPHCWLDPVRVRTVVAPHVLETLERLDPVGAPRYRAGLARFSEELVALHAELEELFRKRRDPVVALHPAWTYFAERYGLGEVPVVERVPGEAPSPRTLADLIRDARRARVERLLIEPQLPQSAARALADEIGASLVLVDPLGDPRDPARADYSELLRFNAYAIAGLTDSAPVH